MNIDSRDVQNCLQRYIVETPQRIRMLMVPHAATQYSGLASHIAFASAAQQRIDRKRIVLLCTRHSGESGLLDVSTCDGATPSQDHSYTHQLPFLAKYFPNVPHTSFLVGPMNEVERKGAAVRIDALVTPDTLLVVSGDFMHVNGDFHHAVPVDQPDMSSYTKHIEAAYVRVLGDLRAATDAAYAALDPQHEHTICGHEAFRLMVALKCAHSWDGSVACYYTSRHATQTPLQLFRPALNDGESSVSYIAMIYRERPAAAAAAAASTLPALTPYERHAVQYYAKEVVRMHLTGDANARSFYVPFPVPSWRATCGVFVTFKNNGKLRGCMGMIFNHGGAPVLDNVRKQVLVAGFEDPRGNLTGTNPLQRSELVALEVTVSFLDRPIETTLDEWQKGTEGLSIVSHERPVSGGRTRGKRGGGYAVAVSGGGRRRRRRRSRGPSRRPSRSRSWRPSRSRSWRPSQVWDRGQGGSGTLSPSRAVFLPDVPTEERWGKEETVRHLVSKMYPHYNDAVANDFIEDKLALTYTLYRIPAIVCNFPTPDFMVALPSSTYI